MHSVGRTESSTIENYSASILVPNRAECIGDFLNFLDFALLIFGFLGILEIFGDPLYELLYEFLLISS
jgi:hypothetical protein